jgi:flagellar protein FliS
MTTDPGRLRYLADSVATATPAQRVVMLYDRLSLDIERAATAAETAASVDAGAAPTTDHVSHVRHAQQIVAELMSSLDVTVWSGAHDLASIYGYLIIEFIAAHRRPDAARLRATGVIVADLRSAWFTAAQKLAQAGTPADRVPVTSGAWVS